MSLRGYLLASYLAIGCCLLMGCGQSSSSADASTSSEVSLQSNARSQSGDGSAALLRRRRVLLRRVIGKLDNPKQACGVLSDRFLKDSYGAPGERGRNRCERQAAKHAQNHGHIESSAIKSLSAKRARVVALGSDEQRTELLFVFLRSRGWLLDDAAEVESGEAQPETGEGSP